MHRGTPLNLEHVIRPASRTPESGESARSPLLLMLHGRGADEMDLMGLADGIDPRLTIVSARAPYRLGFGYTWYDMPQVGQPDPETLRDSIEKLDEFLREIPEVYDVDPERIYLMGFSQGGIISSALALLMPGRFRGVIMHSSYVPSGAGLSFQPDAIQGLPFFVAHGKHDGIISVQMGRQGALYLREAGADVTYVEYPIAHSISEESFYDLSEWLTNRLDADEKRD
jgi:phospholipase/carboxylesterase